MLKFKAWLKCILGTLGVVKKSGCGVNQEENSSTDVCDKFTSGNSDQNGYGLYQC